MKKVEICFVVNELYPLNKGGIGRWIYNLLKSDKDPSAVAYTLLLYGRNFHNLDVNAKAIISETYSSIAEIVYLDDLLNSSDGKIDINVLDSFDEFASESYLLYAGLKDICNRQKKDFNYIEFLDYGGPAFFTTQAKRGESWLRHTEVSVRLHSTNSLIVEHEQFHTGYSSWHAKLHDIERKSLFDADLIVTHVDAIADVNSRYYAFPNEWKSKVITSVPPILLDFEAAGEDAEYSENSTERPTFAFTARLAPFKQPHLFIAAAKQLLDRGVDAMFLLASYGWDQNYTKQLKAMVPARYVESIVFMSDLSEKERLAATRNAVIVIPSNYESFCFLAYESLLRHQKVILNKQCVAFGAYDFWQEGTNCLFFDGTVNSLANAMLKSTEWRPSSFAVPEYSEFYWKRHTPPLATTSVSNVDASGAPGLTVLAIGPEIANKVLSPSIDDDHVEFISIEDNWYDGAKVRRLLTGEGYVVFTTPNLLLGQEYLRYAISVLETNPEFVGVVPQYIDFSGRFSFGLRGGDLVSSSVADVGKVGVMGAVIRKSLFRKEDLWLEVGEHWLHAGICRSILEGWRYAVSAVDPCRVFGGTPDTLLSREMSAGITKAFLRDYTRKFGALLVETGHHQGVDEADLYRDLRSQLQNAESMARERLGAIYEMERMIIDRDNHIAADAVMLQERLDAIHTMDRRIIELEQRRR